MFVMPGVAMKVEIVFVSYCYSRVPQSVLTIWHCSVWITGNII